MSIGERLREERQRLGRSQADFAELAGVSKRVLFKWEKGESSPTAAVMAPWANIGADLTYIITGARRDERLADASLDLKEELAAIRRDLLDPDADETKSVEAHVRSLGMMFNADASFLTPDLYAEAQELLDLASNPERLRARRIEEHGAQRARRDRARRRLADWFDGQEYQPGAGAMNMLLSISHEYGVPARRLSDLVEELHADFNDRLAAEAEAAAKARALVEPDR